MHQFRSSCFVFALVYFLFVSGDAAAASKCTSLKYSFAGAAARAKARCKARAARTGNPVDAACLAKVDSKLAKKWGKAEGMGDCAASSELASVEAALNSFLAQLMDAVEPPVSDAVCCDGVDSCWHGLADDEACVQFGGTPGAPGTVCDGATGSCQSPPAGTGQCCSLPEFGVCNGGPALNLSGCVDSGGADFPFFAICLPNGTCAFNPP